MTADDQRPQAGKTTAREIAKEVRDAITRGDFRAGQRLPSTSDLVAQYRVSAQTVQNAYDLLKSDGLIDSLPRKGFYVRKPVTVQRLARNRLAKEARRQGRGWFLADAEASGFTATVDVTISREPADQRTADALNIEPGAEVVARHRVMSADGVPVQRAISRFPAALVAGTRIEQTDTGETGAWGVLEELGHAVATPAVELVSTRMPTPEERDLLQLADGVPVLDVTRVAYDADEMPLEINDMLLAGDRYKLSYDINVD